MQPSSESTCRLSHNSLERLVPDWLLESESTGLETYKLHIERYEFASRHLTTGDILDVGCGVGYGTQILATGGKFRQPVVGIDLAPEAIEYAQNRYSGPGVRFQVKDAMSLGKHTEFDAIVALEIIEHLDQPGQLVKRLAATLRPHGLLIASAPTTPSTDLNPFHLSDFNPRSFRRLFTAHGLVELDCLHQVQVVDPRLVLRRKEARMQELRSNLAMYYLRHPESLLRRVLATIQHGLSNHYLTIAWQKRS